MFLLNLTLAQFLALGVAATAIVVTLYLLDRARQRHKVATLRFWNAPAQVSETRHRRKIQQPVSLLLQVAGMLLLLLAIAQLHIGSRGRPPADHVLILDSSAWMAAQARGGNLMQQARALARGYLRAAPLADRIMLVRADALATPATPFESDRAVLEAAIEASEPGGTALQVRRALEFARETLRLHARRPGEIVMVTAGKIADEKPGSAVATANLRVLLVEAAVENCGIRKIGLHQPEPEPDLWEVFVSVRNYGENPRRVQLALQFGGAIVGSRRLNLGAKSDENASFRFRSRAAGTLEARLLVRDGFSPDNSARLEVPARHPLRVVVYTEEPALFRPALRALPIVEASFFKPAEYDAAREADIVVLDRFAPGGGVSSHSIWIEPPAQGSPVRVRAVSANPRLRRWSTDHPLAAGLRTQDLTLDSASVFQPASGDAVVAEAADGPIIVARSGQQRLVALGFHPARSALQFDLATPLLFANILRWMSEDVFRRWELSAGSVGSVRVAVEKEPGRVAARVLDGEGQPLPLALKGSTLEFFAGTPGVYRVFDGQRETVHWLTLPEVGESSWEAPSGAARGLPSRAAVTGGGRDLWRWLALCGALVLLAEYLLYGSGRRSGQALDRALPAGMPAAPKGVLLRLRSVALWRRAS